MVGSGYVLLPVLRADLVVRLHWLPDSQLLDAITTLEALFGIEIELSFRLAFRVAALWRQVIRNAPSCST